MSFNNHVRVVSEKIITDFSDLVELREKLSQDGTIPSEMVRIPDRTQTIPTGNQYLDFNSFFDAASAAVKAFPIAWVDDNKTNLTTSKKERYIALGGKGHRIFFRYKMPSHKKSFASNDRISAFKTIMFCFIEVRKIDSARIHILENDNSSFSLTIDGILLVSSTYKRFTGNFPMLKSLKGIMLKDALRPDSDNDESARQIGIKFRESVLSSSTPTGIQMIPGKDYSVFRHEEKIQVSTKPGYVEPDHNSRQSNASTKIVYPGRSLPAAPPKERPPEPWLVNKWADRYDHDD